MPELLLELFSEEIPARMQARAAEDLARLVGEALAALSPAGVRTFHGPRRIALAATLATEVAAAGSTERGPRVKAPEAALAGFLKKHGATRDQVAAEGEYWVLRRQSAAMPAATLIAQALPGVLRRFPWPKSMRWGGGSAFTWVRPLRRILCILDGAVVPFDLRDGEESGHGLASGDLTEGHRFHAPGAFPVGSAAAWEAGLRERFVLVDAAERRRVVADGIAALAAAEGLAVVPDAGLLDEVAGLVEWPVPLLGRIDAAFMDLPPEVMQLSMRLNQRYFALRTADGAAAPHFAFAANIAATDGGAAIIAGNERVLRARFSDARHFWDLDRRTPLANRVEALDRVTFHAKLGSQGERARRIAKVAEYVATLIGADPVLAGRAGLLAKADLTTGMVDEFPELQGVMGGYYAAHDGEAPEVAAAIRDQYLPKGPADTVPFAPLSIAVALADKLDQLLTLFLIGEKPTGSGDPYALRRAALGIIRVIRENKLRIAIRSILEIGHLSYSINNSAPRQANPPEDRLFILEHVMDFIVDRLRVQLRTEGARHDVLTAVFAAKSDDDLVRLLARTDAIAAVLETPDGTNLLAATKRAANILRIEDGKDGPHEGAVIPDLLQAPEEQTLAAAIGDAVPVVAASLRAEAFGDAMRAMAGLRPALDAFFDRVTVNDPDPDLRRNRLRLLRQVCQTADQIADFSRIEG